MSDKIGLQMDTTLNNRLIKLAQGRALKLGLTTLSRPKYLEMLLSEEEKRVENAAA